MMGNCQRDRQNELRVIALFCENRTLAEVGEIVGLSRQRVHQILARAGVRANARTRPRRDDWFIRRHRVLTTRETFWARVGVRGVDECWEWKGRCHPQGYGIYDKKLLGRFIRGAHQAAWIFSNKRLPTKWVLHRCDNEGCCNPNHLYEGTPHDNYMDRVRAGTSGRFTPRVLQSASK